MLSPIIPDLTFNITYGANGDENVWTAGYIAELVSGTYFPPSKMALQVLPEEEATNVTLEFWSADWNLVSPSDYKDGGGVISKDVAKDPSLFIYRRSSESLELKQSVLINEVMQDCWYINQTWYGYVWIVPVYKGVRLMDKKIVLEVRTR